MLYKLLESERVCSGICTKGEKGDKGDQGEQGVAGENGAAGAQGEPGQNAPSPQIDPETGNWIVYVWDEATGDYKATVTDVYAQATKVFVVEKEGFIELNVDGVAYLLPTTSDAYTVEAPYQTVEVTSEYAKWNPTSANSDYQTLLKAFPELAEIEKDTRLTQGGELPVLVTPASIDLTDGFKFSLQHITEGIVEDITLSNPKKGLSDDWKIENNVMTRSASAADCYWTLQVEQALVKNEYATIKNAALVVENANGKVVKTPFSYTIGEVNDLTNRPIKIIPGNTPVEYASEIDLFAAPVGESAPISLENEFNGKYIITLPNQLQVEKYGLSIVDGHKLVIANPGSETNIKVTVHIVALGLNGSVAHDDIDVTIENSIPAVGQLQSKDIILSTKALYTGAEEGQYVTWNFDELKLSTATQKQTFISAANKVIKVYDKDDEVIKTYPVSVLNAANELANYSDAQTLRIALMSKDLIPGDYKVVLEASNTDANGKTIMVYKTETTMKVSNPAAEDIFKLASGYVKDGVMQAVGNSDGSNITFDIQQGIVVPSYATLITSTADDLAYVDMDKESWLNSDGSATWGIANWVSGKNLVIPVEGKKFTNISTTAEDESKETTSRLYKTRNIRATYYLFGNQNNTIDYEFEVEVVSPVYSTEPTSVVKVDATKLTLDATTQKVDIATITKAVYAAGKKAGQEYYLFDTPKVDDNILYNKPKTSGNYVVNSANVPVEIDREDLIAFGMAASDYVKLDSNQKFYVQTVDQKYSNSTLVGWNTIYADKDGKYKNLFNKYKNLIAFESTSSTTTNNAADELVDAATISFVSPTEAEKYAKLSGTTVTRALQPGVDMPAGQVKVVMQIVVKDKWGMTMKVPFEVTIKQ